jgi:hypothetical protein
VNNNSEVHISLKKTMKCTFFRLISLRLDDAVGRD